MRKIAFERKEAGYRMLHKLIQRKGLKVNYKKVYRIYRSEKPSSL
ncbi:MAG: IS3 family transposase [Fibrobacterota bacterium]